MRLSVRYALLAAPLLTATVLVLGSVPPANAVPAQHGWRLRPVTLPRNTAVPGFSALFCTTARSCVAGGASYPSRPPYIKTAAFIDTEAAGTWSRPTRLTLPGSGSSDGGVHGLGCWSTGNCVAVGDFTDASGARQAFTAPESGGSWAAAQQVLLPANAESSPYAELTAISCAAPSSCQAVGGYNASRAGPLQPGLMMAVTDKHGTWQRATQIAAPPNAYSANPEAFLASVSCPTTTFCVAVGKYASKSGEQPLLAIESRGRWHRARQVHMPAELRVRGASLNSVSCTSKDWCMAVGAYDINQGTRRAFAVPVRGGKVGRPVVVTARATDGGPAYWFDSVSCAGHFCVAAGGLHLGARPILVTYAHGRWAHAVVINPPANAERRFPYFVLDQVACLRSGACTAAGEYSTRDSTGLVVASRP